MVTILAGMALAAAVARSPALTLALDTPADPAGFTAHARELLSTATGLDVSSHALLQLSYGAARADLGRVFAACQAQPPTCDAQLAAFLASAREAFRPVALAMEPGSVRVVVRSRAYVEQATAAGGAQAAALQVRPLASLASAGQGGVGGNGLMEVAVQDGARTVRPLTARDLAVLGLTADELFALGRANTAHALRPLAEVAHPAAAGQVGSVGGSVLEVGRLALHDQWSGLAQAQRGILVIVVPTTDLVLYVSDTSPAAIGALRAMAQNVAAAAPNPLAPSALYRWRADGWEAIPSGQFR
jgi:hypothetical protein